MVIYEIENMETHESCYVQAASEQYMISELKNKGFTEVPDMFLAGHNAKGEEVSAMEATFAHISSLIPLLNQTKESC